MYLKKYVTILRNFKNLLLQFFNLSWNTPESHINTGFDLLHYAHKKSPMLYSMRLECV